MPGRFLILITVALLGHGCGGADKHLPSLNPLIWRQADSIEKDF